MEQIARIDRTIKRARSALRSLQQAGDIDAQFDAWEQFLSEWRKGLNQIADYLRTTDGVDRAETMHSQRFADPILDYVWEARNAEEHTATGAHETALVKMTRRVAHSGNQVTVGGIPVVVTTEESELKFRELTVKRLRNIVVLSPPHEAPNEVAEHSQAFLEKCRNLIP